MKKKIAALLFLVMLLAVGCASASSKATLKSKMATRTGPGTNYTELGTYFSKGHSVTALTKCYDSKNHVWWIEVEFQYRNKYRRAYTGHARLSVSLGQLSEEKLLYTAALISDTVPYYGPGEKYEAYQKTLGAGRTGKVYAEEDGWVQFEYKGSHNQSHRVWVPTEAVEAIRYPDESVAGETSASGTTESID